MTNEEKKAELANIANEINRPKSLLIELRNQLAATPKSGVKVKKFDRVLVALETFQNRLTAERKPRAKKEA